MRCTPMLAPRGWGFAPVILRLLTLTFSNFRNCHPEHRSLDSRPTIGADSRVQVARKRLSPLVALAARTEAVHLDEVLCSSAQRGLETLAHAGGGGRLLARRCGLVGRQH